MAQLNLVPNPGVLVVQAMLFFTALGIVKKFFLTPYLKLLDRREKATHGNKAKAHEIAAATIEHNRTIENKLAEAAAHSKQVFDSIRLDTSKKREAIIAEAELEAVQLIEKVHFTIQNELRSEKDEIPKAVDLLTTQFLNKLVN